MNRAFLLLGGNLGNRFFCMFRAIRALAKKTGVVVNSSSFYLTKAWGKEDQPDFLNVALELHTGHSPEELLKVLKQIEQEQGGRSGKWEPRYLDIDILLFNDLQQDAPHLIIPHPELANRRFALTPLCEIAPAQMHPVSKRTIQKMLEECRDPLSVGKI